MTMTEKTSVKLADLPDADFRNLVDRELRKDHPSTPADEREYLKALSPKFRDPAVIDRWIFALEIMKASSETQLSAKRSDLKKTHGTIPDAEYQTRRRAYESWKAGNVRFLHSVQQRLLEARALRAVRFGQTYPYRLVEERNQTAQALVSLRKAIETHRATVLDEDYEPTDADTALWAAILEHIVEDGENAPSESWAAVLDEE